MKKFVGKAIAYGLVMILLLITLDLLSMGPLKGFLCGITDCEYYMEAESGIESIRPAIEAVQCEDGATVLIIGDSISNQLFSEFAGYNPGITVACTNAAVNVTGQYMMARAFLDSHPEATDIWLFMHPKTIVRSFDTTLGYPYAVMPFLQYDMLSYLEKETIDGLASVYTHAALNKNFLNLILASPINYKLYLNGIHRYKTAYTGGSSLYMANLYLCKLKKECEKRGVTLHFLASPSTEHFREENESYREEFESLKLGEAFPDYYESIYYYDNLYSDDLSHLGVAYQTTEIYIQWIRNAYGDTGLLEVFCLGEE